jgi:hypothetical protein
MADSEIGRAITAFYNLSPAEIAALAADWTPDMPEKGEAP